MDLIVKNSLYNIKVRSLAEMGLKPKYIVDRKDERNKHTYTIDNWETWYVGVSTVLETLNKPFLVPWAAKMCAERSAMLIKKLRDGYAKKMFKRGYVEDFKPQEIAAMYERLLSNKKIDRVTNFGKKGYLKIKDSAADIGSRAHQEIDNMIKGQPVTITPDIENPINGFLHWLSITNLTIVSGDIKVASVEEEFGGSIDVVFADKGQKIVIGDFKTSKQFSDSFAAQVGGYSKAFAETYGLNQIPPGFILRFDKIKPEVEIRGIQFINESWKWFQSLLWAHRMSLINFYDTSQKWSFKPPKNNKKETKP